MKVVKLGDIVNNLDNKRKPLNNLERSKLKKRGLYPYCGANGILDYIDEYIFDEEILCIAEDGGNWGHNSRCCYIMKEKCWVNNHAHVVTACEGVILKYLYYYLNYADLSSNITGTTRGKLTKSALNSIEIQLPSVTTQHKIVAVLDKAQSLIDKRKEQIKEYDKLIESLFYDMFGDPISNPKRWKVNKCIDITSKIGSGATPKGGNQSYKDKGISLIRSLNVYNNYFNYNNLAYIDEKQASRLDNVIVEKDDILLNITGASVARCCIVPLNVLPARVNQHVSIIRPNKKFITSIFLNSLLTNRIFQQHLLRIANNSGATREAITKKEIEQLNIITPPIELQNKFAKKVEKIEHQKQLLEQSLTLLEDNFNALMQKAFRGELF